MVSITKKQTAPVAQWQRAISAASVCPKATSGFGVRNRGFDALSANSAANAIATPATGTTHGYPTGEPAVPTTRRHPSW